MSLSKLGRYDLVRVLGKGAMGTVYEARDPDLQRRVAVKTIAVQGLSDEGVRDYEIRFRTEARSCARLQHPHIVSVYDAGRDGDTAYLVMEYVEGNDLKHHLDQGVRFTLDQTLRIMRELLSALAYAHAQNVVHRDVKPANLLLEADGHVKLTDFGVARIQDNGDATRTRGLMVGTLKYMSPEQVQGQTIDARADLFSAGIVLYQLLTGRQPFTGDSEFGIIAQIVGADPAAPSTIHPALPAAIDAVVACALAKERDHRYATAEAFGDALTVACGLAVDRNTAPPAAAIGLRSGALATGAFSTSGRPVGAPTVTQELELVYWKDVRDSDEALDLQGFLDRFPGGIYADLARRKLGKLGVVFVGEQTATRVEPRGVAASASTGPAQEGDRPLAATPSQGAHASPPKRHSFVSAMAGIATIALAAAGFVWWFSGAPPTGVSAAEKTDPPVMLSAPAPASEPSFSAGDSAATASVSTAPVEPASARAASVAPASPKALAVSPPVAAPPNERSTGSATVPRTEKRESAPIANAVASTNRSTAKAAASVRVAANPEAACTGRILLGYQLCLNEQCARPTFGSHPLCEQRRAAEQALRQQQANRN